MKKLMFILFMSLSALLNGQEKFTISGYVSDFKTGENLIGIFAGGSSVTKEIMYD